MTERIFSFCLTILVLLTALPASAARLSIGYLELADDPRYAERTAYARIQLRSHSRPLPGAQVAIEESAMIGQVMDMEFRLSQYRGEDTEELLEKIGQWRKQDVRFVLLDLPAGVVDTVARKTRDQGVLLFNVSAPENSLRRDRCQPHLMHTLPSHGMSADALMQYLASRKWRKLLLLQGAQAEDRLLTEAIRHSADRFGAKIVDVKRFELGNDPRARRHNNIHLLTSGDEYDAVVVADSEGEFGRYVPYQTQLPRPVVGTTGLTPSAWSRVYERHGAPQVNDRFEQYASRPMRDRDWAAWAAVKAIVQSALRMKNVELDTLEDYLRSERLNVDGAKGPALDFRSWNNQMRQPILLATHDAVIARAPIDGFLHAHDALDTLGDDAEESTCHFENNDTSE